MNLYGRVYKNAPIWKLIRLKSFFLTCKFPMIISNLNSIYNFSSKILGKRFINKTIKFVYGDIFLAGENSKDLSVCMTVLKKDGLISIADYAREFLTKEEEINEIHSIIKAYKESIDVSIEVDKNNSIAMKISSFGNVDMLKKVNHLQLILTVIEEHLLKGENYDTIKSSLEMRKVDCDLKPIHIEQLYEVFNKKGKIKNYDLNLFEIILQKNSNLQGIVQELFNLNNNQFHEISQYSQILHERLMSVFSYACEKKCFIMVDAEQSYLKFISDAIVAYYFKQFNKFTCILAQTLQCYLRSHREDFTKWYRFCKENDLKLGLKLVRGAYMNEEGKISKEMDIESPVWPTIEQTHNAYNTSIQFVFNNYKEGDRFCIATHNIDSISLVREMSQKFGRNENIFTAQLLGIADHATGFCKTSNIKNAKYVPFGNFDILIPYLIRRAEESSMIQKLETQNKLLNQEFLVRLKLVKDPEKILH